MATDIATTRPRNLSMKRFLLEWPDLWIARSALFHYLEDNEFYMADAGYNDGYQWAETHTGHNNPEKRIYALAQAHHETVTVNGHFNCFGCLSMK